MPLLGRLSEPRDRLVVALFRTFHIAAHVTKVVLRLCIPGLGRFSVSLDCLSIVQGGGDRGRRLLVCGVRIIAIAQLPDRLVL